MMVSACAAPSDISCSVRSRGASITCSDSDCASWLRVQGGTQRHMRVGVNVFFFLFKHTRHTQTHTHTHTHTHTQTLTHIICFPTPADKQEALRCF